MSVSSEAVRVLLKTVDRQKYKDFHFHLKLPEVEKYRCFSWLDDFAV